MPGTDIVLDGIPDVQFTNSKDIDNFFQQLKGANYIKWFNANLSNQGPWKDVRLVDTPQNDVGFHAFWNQIDRIFGGPIDLSQFVCLMSILSNEVRGNFSPKTEAIGVKGHPGISYCFDAIPGTKKSYNTLSGNRTALECFQHELYVAAHGALALGSQWARTPDTRWSGEKWLAEVVTDSNIAVSGFVTQADFMKFRGRGFIQTTGRANYLPLIEFVQSYDGENSTLDFYQHRWLGKPPDQIAFESTNDDWDILFQQSDLIIATEAVRVHNEKCGNYLALSSDAAVLNGNGAGSVFNMGKKISGADSYAGKFKDRIVVTLAGLAGS
jgi:hypothetical protein